MMDYSTFTDDELMELLYSEEDRLPRAVVDEFVRRGERMVPWLSEIVSDQFRWTKEIPEWWAVVHAVFILGAIGTELTVIPLLRALRWADAFDCDWVTECLPAMFGQIGPIAIGPLKAMAEDCTNGCFTQGMALDGLGLIARHYPERQKEISAVIHAIFMDEKNHLETRQSAGGVLLDMKCAEYKDDLLAFARQEEGRKRRDKFYFANFLLEDVEEAFAGRELDTRVPERDWLTFYDEKEIAQRQERWKKEEKMEAEEKHRVEEIVNSAGAKVGRNDPCPCGSGKKHKKCCLGKAME